MLIYFCYKHAKGQVMSFPNENQIESFVSRKSENVSEFAKKHGLKVVEVPMSKVNDKDLISLPVLEQES